MASGRAVLLVAATALAASAETHADKTHDASAWVANVSDAIANVSDASSENYVNCWTRDKDEVSSEKGHDDWQSWAKMDCSHFCPRQQPPEESAQCSAHAYESKPRAERHDNMFWYIMSVALCLVMGALNRVAMPSWIPYTVSLLIEAMVLGVIAATLEDRNWCPMNALHYYDFSGDGHVDAAERAKFICVGCHPDSVCAARSCGDGSAVPSGCAYTFEGLDSVSWKTSAMQVDPGPSGSC